MADISKIKLPSDSTVYNLKDANAAPLNRGVEYIRGTWASASGTWTGVSADSSLYDGKKIMLFLPYAGSGNATLNLTLDGGTTTGAKSVYLSGTTRVTTEYDQYSHVMLVYHSALNIGGTNYEGWWCAPEGGLSGDYEIVVDPSSRVGLVETGDAVTSAANYTPSGDIILTKDSVNYVTGAALSTSYSNAQLSITGINLTTSSGTVFTDASFKGSGVHLIVREKEDN